MLKAYIYPDGLGYSALLPMGIRRKFNDISSILSFAKENNYIALWGIPNNGSKIN